MKRKRAIKLMMSAAGTGNRSACRSALDGFKYDRKDANQPAAAWLIARAALRCTQDKDLNAFLRCKKALKCMGVELEIDVE